jgi:hypothetical protein
MIQGRRTTPCRMVDHGACPTTHSRVSDAVATGISPGASTCWLDNPVQGRSSMTLERPHERHGTESEGLPMGTAATARTLQSAGEAVKPSRVCLTALLVMSSYLVIACGGSPVVPLEPPTRVPARRPSQLWHVRTQLCDQRRLHRATWAHHEWRRSSPPPARRPK